MRGIPVLVLAGFSGAGKTTLIEALIPRLSAAGLRVAVLKHDAHGEAADQTGTDSRRLFEAGAAVTVVSGPGRTAIVRRESEEPALKELLRQIEEVDIILVEGYKRAACTQLGLSRRETGKGFTDRLSRFAAVVTDESVPECEVPLLHPDDIDGIARFILENRDSFSCI